MPIVNGVYQAPTWVNNGPPAMDETEMQAICDTVAQTGNVTTPAQTLGLSGDLSIGASLGVLATVGDLNVWRRTVTSGVGDYSLSEKGRYPLAEKIPNSGAAVYVEYGDSISVDAETNVTISNPSNKTIYPENPGETDISFCYGKYCQFSPVGVSGYQKKTYFIDGASGTRAVLSFEGAGNNVLYGYNVQLVITPTPDTYVDYPVSVNPNAYKTGSDAKPAGYTLGAVQSGQFYLCQNSSASQLVQYYYGSSVQVSESGEVTLTQQNGTTADNESNVVTRLSAIKGSFIFADSVVRGGIGDFALKQIIFVPIDSQIVADPSTGCPYITQYQTVTGYPAIPAGTTIEYLGALGDKTRIVTGSYMGTGTFGSGNQNTLTFPFKPKIWGVYCFIDSSGNVNPMPNLVLFGSGAKVYFTGRIGDTPYYNTVSYTENSCSWYTSYTTPESQLNGLNRTYYYFAIA